MSRILARVSGCVVAALVSCGLASAAPPVTAGLTLSLTATAGVTTSGSTVTSWTNQAAGAQVFNTPLGGTQLPTIVNNAINGKPVIRFDGINDYMETTAAVSNFVTSTAFTAFAVVKANPGMRNSFSYDNNQIWADAGGYIGMNVDAGATATVYHYSSTGNAPEPAVSIPTGQYIILTGRHDGGFLITDLFGGGSASLADTGATAPGGLNAKLRLSGGFNSPSDTHNYFNGDIAELLIYNRALTSLERTDVQNYLNATWLPEPGCVGVVLLGGFFGLRRVRSKRVAAVK